MNNSMKRVPAPNLGHSRWRLRLRAHLPIFISLTILCGYAHAGCVYPQVPDNIPNGYTATQAEMTKALVAFKAFSDAITAYNICLDQQAAAEIAKGGKDPTPQQIDDETAKKHNAAVDDLQSRAEQINTEVRAFNVLHK